MKKFYFQLLLAILAVGFGFDASAASVTFEWTAPEADAVTLKAGNLGAAPIELPAGATSYTFEQSGAFADAYILLKDGYYFKSITPAPSVISKQPYYNSTYGWYVGGRFNATQLAALNGGPVKFEIAKIERDEKLTINVINGSSDLSVKFTAQMPQEFTVKNGVNTIDFLSAIDQTMQITTKSGLAKQPIYSITLNDKPIPVKYNLYYEFTPKNGDKVEIRVYEGEEVVKKDVSLTFDFPEALKDCIYNIRDWSAGKFINDFSNLTFPEGSDIAINLQPDYDYEKIYLNDQDVTAKLNTSGTYPQLRFDIQENTVLKIEGKVKEYGTIDFKGYIVNPEGVVLRLGAYASETVAELADGTALTDDIALGHGYTIKADQGKLFTVPVSEKNPKIFIFAKEGYYIETAQTKLDGTFEAQTSVSAENSTSNTFYVIARPYVADAKIKFDVRGDEKVVLSGAMSMGYDNPEPVFSLKKGIQTIDFCAGLSAPLRLRYFGLEETDISTFYDGLRLTHDEDSESLYLIPAPGEDEIPTVVVKNTTTPLAAGTVSVTGDPEAKIYYGEYLHERPAADSYFLFGTTIVIKPSTSKFTATLNGEPLAADWQGRLTFDIASATSKVVISANTFALAGVTPADGSTVKNLSQLVLAVDYDGSDEMPFITEDKLAGITLVSGATTIAAKEIGEMSMNDFGQLLFPILFEGEFAAGEYTLTVPAGTFCMAAYDEDAEAYVPVEGGATSAAFTAAYTVDPTMKGKLEEYIFTPAAGSAIKSIDQIVIAFPAYTAYEMGFDINETGSYITDGTNDYAVAIGYDWNSTESRAFAITPLNADEEPFELTADATWTLHLAAGAISKEGEQSPIIDAEFKTGASLPVYNLTPAAGSAIRSFSEFKISFPGVYEIEYLGEDDYSKAIYYTNEAGDKTYAAEVKVPTNAGYATFIFANPSTPGEYTVVIPEGAFTLDEEPSLACEAKYTLVVDWKLSPENGTQFSELPEFTLEFPDATTVEFVGGGASASIRAGWTWGIALDVTPVEGADHPTFKLSVIEGGSTPPNASLQLEVEEGAFIVDGEPSGQITGFYTFYRELSTDYELDPSTGVIVWSEYGAYWTIIFDEAGYVRNNGPLPSAITVTLDGEPLAYGTDYEVNLEGNKVLFGIYDTARLKEGKLEMTVAAGALLFGGKEVPEIKASFDLCAPKEYTYTITPDPSQPTASLDEITIAFPEAKTASIYMESGAFLRSGNYSFSCTPALEIVEDADVPTLKLTMTPAPTADGKYILNISTGTLTLDSNFQSPEIKAEFTLDALAGVEGIEIDATDKAIYNLQGIRLDVDWNDLPAGVYIVNGKKVAKK